MQYHLKLSDHQDKVTLEWVAYTVDTVENEMIPMPGGMRKDHVKLHHGSQNGVQFKMYGFFISGILYLLFGGCD